MPRTKLTKAKWQKIQRCWEAGGVSFSWLARKYGLHRNTIARRAKDENWQRRPDSASPEPSPISSGAPPNETARVLYEDLSKALRDGLEILNDTPAEEKGAEARDRVQLVRAHRRALAALIEAERFVDRHSLSGPSSEKGPHKVIDLDAARIEIIARLERLSAQVTAA